MTDIRETQSQPKPPEGQTKEQKLAAIQEQINKLVEEREKLKA